MSHQQLLVLLDANLPRLKCHDGCDKPASDIQCKHRLAVPAEVMGIPSRKRTANDFEVIKYFISEIVWPRREEGQSASNSIVTLDKDFLEDAFRFAQERLDETEFFKYWFDVKNGLCIFDDKIGVRVITVSHPPYGRRGNEDCRAAFDILNKIVKHF